MTSPIIICTKSNELVNQVRFPILESLSLYEFAPLLVGISTICI